MGVSSMRSVNLTAGARTARIERVRAKRCDGIEWAVIAAAEGIRPQALWAFVHRWTPDLIAPRECVDWTDDRIETLTALWHAGRSIRAIGAEMQISHNAVIGKARRLGLPERGSPIGRRGKRAIIKAQTEEMVG